MIRGRSPTDDSQCAIASALTIWTLDGRLSSGGVLRTCRWDPPTHAWRRVRKGGRDSTRWWWYQIKVRWCFNLVMDSIPLLLHASLLLLGCGLSNYLFFLDQTVAGVVIGFTSFCLIFYFVSSAAAVISEHCPFQTPLSLTLRHLAHRLIPKAWWKDNSRRKPRPSRPKTKTAHHIVLPIWMFAADPNPLFSHREIDWDGYVVYFNCVTWMFEKPVDHDTVMAIIGFIPEIVWHNGIKTIQLERTYDNLLECFDDKLDCPTVLSRCRDRAYLSAKAVLHMIIQRRCLGDVTDVEIFDSIAARHPRMGCWGYDEDSDLGSTLSIIDIVLGAPMPTLEWQALKFTTPHHSWMAHILLYRAWDTVGTANNLSEDVTGFIKYTLSLDPPPSTAIVADCLLMIGLILGIGIHVDDLSVVDKRYAQSRGDYRYICLLSLFQPGTQTPDRQDLRKSDGDPAEARSDR